MTGAAAANDVRVEAARARSGGIRMERTGFWRERAGNIIRALLKIHHKDTRVTKEWRRKTVIAFHQYKYQ
jgi:hypothetical protein